MSARSKNVNIYKKVLTEISGCYLLMLLAATDEDQLQTGRRGKPTEEYQVESVTEGRHKKRFVAHRGRRDSVRGAEGESHFRRLRDSNKSRALACFLSAISYMRSPIDTRSQMLQALRLVNESC